MSCSWAFIQGTQPIDRGLTPAAASIDPTFPECQLFLWQGIEDAVIHDELPLHGAKRRLPLGLQATRQATGSPAPSDDALAFFHKAGARAGFRLDGRFTVGTTWARARNLAKIIVRLRCASKRRWPIGDQR